MEAVRRPKAEPSYQPRKELEKKNSQRKRLVAELSLGKQIGKDLARGASKP